MGVDNITEDANTRKTTETQKGDIGDVRAEYDARIGIWRYNEDAYDNTGGFLNGSYLFKFSREDDNAFQRRKDICYMINYAKDIAGTVTGHLFKQPITRDVDDDETLTDFLEATNRRGDKNMSELMKEAFLKAYVYEWSYVLVDKPSETFQTLRDEKLDGKPYAYVLSAKDVVDWQKDEYGEYIWIKIKEFFVTNNDIPIAEHETLIRYRIWTRTEWKLYDEDGALKEQGVHKLGVVPIVQIRCDDSIKNPDLGTSIFTSIVQVLVRLFNALSELDSLLINGTFPILVIPSSAPASQVADDDDTSTEKNLPDLGVGSTLNIDPESRQKAEFINADSSTTDAYYNLIDRLKNIMQELARLAYTGGVQSSGVAMAFQFEKTNQMLLSKAETLKDAELAILHLVSLWMDDTTEKEISIEYPKDYNIRDMEKEIKNVFDMLGLQLSDKFNKALKKLASRNLMPSLTTEQQKEIDEEIENGEDLPDFEAVIEEEETNRDEETPENEES